MKTIKRVKCLYCDNDDEAELIVHRYEDYDDLVICYSCGFWSIIERLQDMDAYIDNLDEEHARIVTARGM